MLLEKAIPLFTQICSKRSIYPVKEYCHYSLILTLKGLQVGSLVAGFHPMTRFWHRAKRNKAGRRLASS
jgi:hypothetical protein